MHVQISVGSHMNEFISMMQTLRPFEQNPHPHTYQDSLTDCPRIIYLTIEEGQAVATASMILVTSLYGTSGHLENVATEPNHQRKGYARAAVEEALEGTFRHHLKPYAVKLACKRDSPAYKLYKNLGFKVDDENVAMRLTREDWEEMQKGKKK